MSIKNQVKQKFTRLLCGIFTLVLSLSVLTLTVDAADTDATPRATSGVLNVDTSVGWSLGGTSYGTEGLMTINGDVVYCLERLKTYYSGMTYTGSEEFSSLGIDSSVKEKLSLLAYFGTQRAESTGNVDWYAVVGSAIIGIPLFIVFDNPFKDLISALSGFVITIDIPFAVSMLEPPPTATITSAPDFLHSATPSVTFFIVGFGFISEYNV